MDAAITERFAQDGSLRTYLEEEAELGAEAGGKLRNSILLGMNSPPILSAVRAMALIADSALWKLLRCIGGEEHILDVLPGMWETTLAFFKPPPPTRARSSMAASSSSWAGRRPR